MTEPEKEREAGKEPKVNIELSRLLFDELRKQEEIQRREARKRVGKGKRERGK